MTPNANLLAAATWPAPEDIAAGGGPLAAILTRPDPGAALRAALTARRPQVQGDVTAGNALRDALLARQAEPRPEANTFRPRPRPDAPLGPPSAGLVNPLW
jgi:hypothetical protein